jgi:2-hydroxy-6-oxonona-2,4-dienedioate hydrolase
VIHGRRDPLFPVSNASALAREIPDAKLVILEDCGHAPEFECPAAFVKAVTGFLSGEVK